MAFVRRPTAKWQLGSRSLLLGPRTLVMGVLNVTPDSFSDGGVFFSTDAALNHAMEMLEAGADILDIGGESTRPGSQGISPEEEQERVLPVIEAVHRERRDAVLSIDTWRASTARAALEAGAEIVNDVSAFQWDEETAQVCAEFHCGVVLMHTRGRPSAWRTQPSLAQREVVALVREGLEQSLQRAVRAGVDRSQVVLDPGYGFGKAMDNNYPLLAHQDDLLGLGRPLLAGISRKSFLGHTLAVRQKRADVPVAERLHATLAGTTAAILAGAHIVRVHDVRPAVEAACIADAILAEV